jgi:predicted naringenin-chalcone synthase
MFVLDGILNGNDRRDGIALAFGPGLAAEGFAFSQAA